MAWQNLLVSFTKIIGGTPIVPIGKILTNGTASPEAVYSGAAGSRVVVNLRIIGFEVYNNTGAAQAGATARLQSNLNGAGIVAVSDLLDISIDDVVVRATTIDATQGVLTVAQAAEDILNIAKNNATNAGFATIMAFLT